MKHFLCDESVLPRDLRLTRSIDSAKLYFSHRSPELLLLTGLPFRFFNTACQILPVIQFYSRLKFFGGMGGVWIESNIALFLWSKILFWDFSKLSFVNLAFFIFKNSSLFFNYLIWHSWMMLPLNSRLSYRFRLERLFKSLIDGDHLRATSV